MDDAGLHRLDPKTEEKDNFEKICLAVKEVELVPSVSISLFHCIRYGCSYQKTFLNN